MGDFCDEMIRLSGGRMAKKKKKKSLVGQVWLGFTGEYQKPPCYLILEDKGFDSKTVFISDVLKEFARRKVRTFLFFVKSVGVKQDFL